MPGGPVPVLIENLLQQRHNGNLHGRAGFLLVEGNVVDLGADFDVRPEQGHRVGVAQPTQAVGHEHVLLTSQAGLGS
jgi:hypothetical protein